MFGIGTFARLAQVSVRTLHYYDEQGLLQPAAIDSRTGYRSYNADQLHRLNRILALRDLGLSLREIRDVIEDHVTLDELRGMLRLRRSEAQGRIAADAARLARVDARLRQIEIEDRVADYDIVVKTLPSLRVALIHENAASFGNEVLSPIFARLYEELHGSLRNAGAKLTEPDIALYADSGDDAAPIRVMAAKPVGRVEIKPHGRIEVHQLPAVARAATTVHRGSMSRVEEGYQALVDWSEHTGETMEGYGREVYLQCDGPPETWVTELQFALGGKGAALAQGSFADKQEEV